MNSYIEIDLNHWPRAQHCALFRKMLIPTYTVGFELDVTKFQRQVKEQNLSFTLAMMYVVTQCANGIENFRYRFLDGKVVLYDRCSVNFVWLNQETELFKFVAYSGTEDLMTFVAGAKAAAEAQKEYFVAPPANNAFVFSPLPWVSYTEKSHTHSGNPEAASPIFDWGKFFERDGKLILPFSVQVHHSFADGLHIGKLASALQDKLNGMTPFIAASSPVETNAAIEQLAEENQKKAREVIRASGVREAWESIGAKVNPVGSLAMGLLMKHRDIDFHIYTDTLDATQSFKAIQMICANPCVTRFEYRNLAATDEACFEWHVWYRYEGEEWQIDMIQILRGSQYDGYFEDVAKRIVAVLTPETRRAILELKYQTPETEHIMGIEYYQAVIADGIRTYPEFLEWRKRHPVNGIITWRP